MMFSNLELLGRFESTYLNFNYDNFSHFTNVHCDEKKIYLISLATLKFQNHHPDNVCIMNGFYEGHKNAVYTKF